MMEGSPSQRSGDAEPAARAPWAGRVVASGATWRLGLGILAIMCCCACTHASQAPAALRAPAARPFWSLSSCFGAPPKLAAPERPAHAVPVVPAVRRVKKSSSRHLWEALAMFEVEDSDVSELDEAEKAYKRAEQAKRKVPVTGSSETESALEQMVQMYMGKIQMQMKAASSGGGGAKAGKGRAPVKSARQLEEEEALILRWQEEEAEKAALEQEQYERDLALLEQQQQQHQAHGHAAPRKYASSFSSDSRDEEAWKAQQEERAWKDAVLRACMPTPAQEAASSSDAAARAPWRGRLGERVRGLKERARAKARVLVESARAGRAKALALLEAARPGERPVGDFLHRLHGVAREARSVVKRRRKVLSGKALETMFIALAFLADRCPASGCAGASVDLDGWEKGMEHVGGGRGGVREALKSLARVIPGSSAVGGGRACA